MEAIKFNRFTGSIIFVMALFTVLSLTSCARKIHFTSSAEVPAATGYAKIKRDKNNNYAIEVSVRNLAPSANLRPPRETYVVWIETEHNGIKNLGQINSSSGLFSKKLKASLNTVTSFSPTRFFITAEDNGDVQHPGIQEILRTRSF